MTELDRSQLHELYYFMKLTRSLEERLEYLFRLGKVVGGLYRSLGQEAESVGAALALGPDDLLAPSIRNLGALLVRGVRPVEVLLQYTARAAGPTRGKDNTLHFHDRGRGIVGPVAPLGTTLCVIAGVTLSFKLRREPRVGLTFLGDGASRTGTAHEGLCLAAAQRLPLVVVVENNGWAFATRTSEETALEQLVEMAAGYGMRGEQVDGNDVRAVYRVCKDAVGRAREGEGPSLIEVITYRMRGHAQHDTQKYVPAEELEAWEARDPIKGFVQQLVGEGLATEPEIAAIDRRVDVEVAGAVELALESPHPEPEQTLAGVFREGAQSAPWARTIASPGALRSEE